MKEINTQQELEEISKNGTVIIEFGMAEGCIPCKMTKDNLKEIEDKKIFEAEYYFCPNIDIMAERGYTSVPVVQVISPNVMAELDDSGVSMDEDDLTDWIKEKLER